jgi:hypothetical protein
MAPLSWSRQCMELSASQPGRFTLRGRSSLYYTHFIGRWVDSGAAMGTVQKRKKRDPAGNRTSAIQYEVGRYTV